MFTKTFRHTPGPELMGNAVVLFAIGAGLDVLEEVVINAMLIDQGSDAAGGALIVSLFMRIPAFILYFAAALMGLLGVVACGVERAAVIRQVNKG